MSAVAGRHHTSSSRGDNLLRQHGAKFTSFSMIGGGIFVAGLVIQAVLTSGLHVSSLVSYLVQAVVSVEASYFLNRWFTWRGEKSPFWPSFARFNLQKLVTVTLNLVLYAVLLKLGVQYLLDNILLTVVFTFVNYIGADRFVFLRGTKQMVAAVTGPIPVITGPMPVLRFDRRHALRARRTDRALPSISVTIPVRSNEKTIRAAVESILRQDYPMLRELILVGSPGDSTWLGLRGIHDPRLFVLETNTPPGIRDANFKRDYGIRRTSGDLIALIDSDMVIPPDWMSNAVRLLLEGEVDCVAGVMLSIHDDFWGRFVDGNRLGAKTPRAKSAYLVTAEGFGAAGYKPPITADILFTRRMYEDCPIDSSWSHGSLEDYEWFWRVVERGHKVLVSNQLFGWHHHRAGFKNLSREYRRSARGCAYFIRAHRDSPFAQKRMSQAIVLPLGLFAVVAALGIAAYLGHAVQALAAIVALCVAGIALLSAREFARNRTLESLVYPVPAMALGLNYTASLTTHLIRTSPMYTAAPTAHDLPALGKGASARGAGLARLWHPLTLILLFQAGVGLSLIWSNTGFSDELNYMWVGTTLINHLLHGTAWPTEYTHTTLSGLPYLYPPIGAIGNMIGGLAGARLISLVFMLCSTGFVFSTARRLYGQAAALCAAALWTAFSPTLQLGGLATYDAMSVVLTAFAAYLVVRTGSSRKRGEFVAAAAVVLALEAVCAYSGLVMIPVVALFALVVWIPLMGTRQALMCASWFTAVTLFAFAAIMTLCRTWPGIITTVLSRQVASNATASVSHVFDDSWTYIGIIAILGFVGAMFAVSSGDWKFALQTAYLAAIAFVIPISQAHEGTAVSLRKHLAYSGMFAAMAAGYGLARFGKSLPAKRWAAIASVGAVFAIPGIDGVQQSQSWYGTWPNLSSMESKLEPLLASHPTLAMSMGAYNYWCKYYYASLGNDWQADCLGTTLTVATHAQAAYIVLGYPSFVTPSDGLPTDLILSPKANQATYLSFLAGEDTPNSPEDPQLAQLTEILENSKRYQLVAVGPWDSNQSSGIYSIWRRVAVQAAKK